MCVFFSIRSYCTHLLHIIKQKKTSQVIKTNFSLLHALLSSALGHFQFNHTHSQIHSHTIQLNKSHLGIRPIFLNCITPDASNYEHTHLVTGGQRVHVTV